MRTILLLVLLSLVSCGRASDPAPKAETKESAEERDSIAWRRGVRGEHRVIKPSAVKVNSLTEQLGMMTVQEYLKLPEAERHQLGEILVGSAVGFEALIRTNAEPVGRDEATRPEWLRTPLSEVAEIYCQRREHGLSQIQRGGGAVHVSSEPKVEPAKLLAHFESIEDLDKQRAALRLLTVGEYFALPADDRLRVVRLVIDRLLSPDTGTFGVNAREPGILDRPLFIVIAESFAKMQREGRAKPSPRETRSRP